jgi:6-phosphogluconolactonase
VSEALDLRLLVGSYTATSGGHATGISVVAPGEDGAPEAGGLVARTAAVVDDPSFLAVSGDRVYAVSETEDGGVHAFRRDGHALEHLWDAPSGGDAPCHIRVDASGTLVVTNYTSGTVTAVALESAETHAASMLASDAVVPTHGAELHTGAPASAIATEVMPDVEGPVVDRQEGPHAHQSIAGPDGTVLVSDLGGDAIHEYRIERGADGSPTITRVRVHHVAPGVGPRHMAWFDGDLIVAGELDGLVHRLRADGSGSLRDVASAPVSDADADADGDALLSHLDVTPDGLVYVAVRGQDTVAVLDARDGGLAFVAAVPCGGQWPRHFMLHEGYLLVANQFSDGIAVLPIGSDGIPGEPVATVRVGSPACVLPLD